MLDPDLGQVLDSLGASLLRPLTELPERPVPISGVLVFERRAPLPPVTDAILLAVGVGTAEARELVGSAAEAGYACLVVKSFGEPVAELVAAAQRSRIVLLSADEAVAWHHLDAMISSALAATVRLARAPTVGDLFALANAIAGMVGGATVIEDPHRRILAYSTLAGQAIDEGRRQGILGLQVPDGPDYDAQYHTLVRVGRTCRFPPVPGGLPRLGVAVRAGSEELGSIWVVDADDCLDAAAEQALSDVADTVSLHLLAARTADDAVRHRRAGLLRRLLADPSSVTAVAPQLGLDPNQPVAVAAFAVTATNADDVLVAHAATRLADLVSLHCEAHYGRHGCALIDGTVYALLPSGPSPNAHRELAADIARRAHSALRVPVHAGLGSLVQGLRSVATSRADADLVLRALTDRPESRRVATIDEVWASATLSALAQILATQEALPRSLGPAVRAHDLQHGTTYAATILAYLEANSDIAVASTRLSVHPNTIRYRLARAEEILGFDLADPDERLVLWLRLRLGDQLGW
ncbi:PucR family transcriptional regulator [Actinocrispum wychmicini]|uniref:PucR-like helix-turn-helix protein n=1 Tax=Actinocrispum wychmicini TaxID=1213861 RepID=A0A4R2JKM8_9PSEU|nr:helix-turn-helix domain-containing protein [Actinocrispum wychmicini]TCO59714.1 PucR-like helix-turn-helix protein [Actinocrispum wychmicini]